MRPARTLLILGTLLTSFVGGSFGRPARTLAQTSPGTAFNCGKTNGVLPVGTLSIDYTSRSPLIHQGDTVAVAVRVLSQSFQTTHYTATATIFDPNGGVVTAITQTFFLGYLQNGQFALTAPIACNAPVGNYTVTLTVSSGPSVCGVYGPGAPAAIASSSFLVQSNTLCGL